MQTEPVTEAMTAVSAAIEQLEGQRDFGDITPEGLESLKILNVCYEMIARTAIIEAQTVIPTEDMVEPGENLSPWPVWMHGTDKTIEDFLFKIAAGKGDISFRDLLRAISNSKRKFTQKEISEAIGIRRATISDYLTHKTKITADKLESIINYIQKQ